MTLDTTKGKTPGLMTHGVFLFMGIITLSLTGCATYYEYEGKSYDKHFPASSYIESIPFFPQEEFQCGPSVLASILNFLGYKIDPEDISKAIYVGHIKGTLKMDMLSFAKRYEKNGRVSVSEIIGDIELIRRDITGGYPVIVFVDLGIWNIRKGHYMLIVGYDDLRGGVIAYSGVEKDKFISYNHFMRTWERGGYWALRIIPG